MSLVENWKDRVPTEVLENGAVRYGIYDSEGNLIRYEYIRREDEPIELGNIWNKAAYDGIKNAINDRVKLADKATTAEAQGTADDTKWMTPAKVLDEINQVALPSKQVSIKTGTASDGTIIPKTDGYSHYMYFVSPYNPSNNFDSSKGHPEEYAGFRMYCSVDQRTRRVTAYTQSYYYVNGVTKGWENRETFTVNYFEIAWN